MQGKPLIMLALAGVMGLGAMLMTKSMLNQQKTPEEPMSDVVAAVRDFKEEEILKPEMLKLVKMPQSIVPVGAYSAINDVTDRWVKTAVLEGEPVVERKLGPKGSPPGLVANIPKGMRAFAVEVNEQSGVSGFILPGHRVDVIKFQSGERTATRGETILQDVLVLASGQVFVKAEEKTVQSRTVTLAVNPDDVDLLVAAKAKGTLSLALRGVNDHEVVDRPREPAPTDDGEEKRKRLELEKTVADLKKQLEEKDKPVPAPPAAIARVGVIYRSDRGKREEYSLAGRGSMPSPALPLPTGPTDEGDPKESPEPSRTSLVAAGRDPDGAARP
jgi:pilus assembly protein CpaB